MIKSFYEDIKTFPSVDTGGFFMLNIEALLDVAKTEVGLLMKSEKGDVEFCDQNLLDFCHELVIVNFLYEQNMLSKDEMLAVKQTIRKSYKQKGNDS